MIIKRLSILFALVPVAAMVLLLAGCAGGGYSIYTGYGYPRYGYDVGYYHYYDHDYYADRYEHRRENIRQRREDRVERIRNMSLEQRQQLANRLEQTRSKRVLQRQVRRASRPVRNMGRPRPAVRRR